MFPIKHWTLFGMAILISASMLAQNSKSVRIVNSESNEVLPFTHAYFHLLSEEGRNWGVLSDASGEMEIPVFFLKNDGEAFAIRISHLGHQVYQDTFSTINDLPSEIALEWDESALQEVVVSAQYSPTSTAKTVHKVQVISAKKIEDMSAVNLRDLLSNNLNIRLSQDNILGSSMSMQGLSGKNVKIMIDGVPVIGRQNGSVDLSQINLNNIEQMELVEGPLAVNYGSNALAGTLNIITEKNSRDKYDIYLNGYTENIGTYNLDAGVSFSVKKHFLSLSGGRNFFDGWHSSDNFSPDFKQQVADSTRFKSWKPKTQYFGRVQYNYQFKKVKLGYKGEFFKEKISNKGLPRAPYNETAFDDYYYTTRIDNAFFVDANIGQNKFVKITAAYNYYKRQKNTYSKDLTTLEESLTENPSNQDTSTFQQWMSRGNFSKSSADHKFNYEVGYDINYESATGERIENKKQSIGDYALFATAEIEPVKSFIIRPGLRYGYNSAYKTPLIPSLNLKYGIKDFTLRASYARGFRAPGVKELYFYFVDVNHYIVGNTDLKAENGHNFSFNAQHRKVLENKLVIKSGISAFYNTIQNLITLALADASSQEYTYANIGKFQTVGGNVDFKVNWKNLAFNSSFGYTGRSNQLENATAPEAFSFYPEVTSNLVYKWEKTGLQAALFYKYQGRLPSYVIVDNQVQENFINDYHTLDLNISKRFYKDIFNITIGCKNLLNVQNVSSSMAGGEAHSSSSTSSPVATGRVLFARLNINISPSKLNKQ